ncbi:hypothetical protein D9M68_854090 [compost metagenome]
MHGQPVIHPQIRLLAFVVATLRKPLAQQAVELDIALVEGDLAGDGLLGGDQLEALTTLQVGAGRAEHLRPRNMGGAGGQAEAEQENDK